MSDSFESEVHEDVPNEIIDAPVDSEISIAEVSTDILAEILSEIQAEEEVPSQEEEVFSQEEVSSQSVEEQVPSEVEVEEEVSSQAVEEQVPSQVTVEEEVYSKVVEEELPNQVAVEEEVPSQTLEEELPNQAEVEEEVSTQVDEEISSQVEEELSNKALEEESGVIQNTDISSESNTDSNTDSENQPPSMESIEDPQYYSNREESSSIESTNTQSTFNSMEPSSDENIQFKLEEVYEQTDNFVHIENIPVELPNTNIPKIVFIIPYRNRENDKRFFDLHMKKILEDYDRSSYSICYIHQKDNRNFNRGAMKNIGFLYCKENYPNDYHNITLVFNDVDTMPSRKGMFNYETTQGTIKHFYGHTHTLGGIFSIKGSDFEKIQGFPNFWAWGYEDNAIYRRATIENIKVDRSEFYNIQDKNVIHLSSGTIRQTNRIEFDRYLKEINENKVVDGYSTISQLKYDFDYTTNMLHVSNFMTAYTQKEEFNTFYDIKNGSQPYKPKTAGKRATGKHLGFFM